MKKILCYLYELRNKFFIEQIFNPYKKNNICKDILNGLKHIRNH